MNKAVAGSAVGAVAALMALGFSAPAQAYPDATPPTEILPAGPTEAAPASTVDAALPNTGGPDETLLLGGLGLVVGGGAAVVVARRRRQTA